MGVIHATQRAEEKQNAEVYEVPSHGNGFFSPSDVGNNNKCYEEDDTRNNVSSMTWKLRSSQGAAPNAFTRFAPPSPI